ncbi:MAG: GAF domain-containing sensor histidine kinase [Bacteroidota bacterium]
MQHPPIPNNEQERLAALQAYQILDTLPEQDFDDITRIASEICGTPISLITLVDENRQWFKSRKGVDVEETPREIAFCAHAIAQPEEMMLVEDPQHDERFHDNPLVIGEPHVRFYAGVPLVNPEGHALGTLCIIDNEERKITAQQIASLKALANQVVAQFELRRKNEELQRQQNTLEEANQALENFAHSAAHDLKSPLHNIIGLTKLLQSQLPAGTTAKVLDIVNHLGVSAQRLKNMVDNLLEFARISEIANEMQEPVNVKYVIEEIQSLLTVPPGFRFHYPDLAQRVITSRTALHQILFNLATNAIKYNDKEEGLVTLETAEDETHYIFRLSDNGPGIPEKNHEAIFDMFATFSRTDRFAQQGTGLGLFIVKRLVKKLDGNISVSSQPGKGAAFTFTIAKPKN